MVTSTTSAVIAGCLAALVLATCLAQFIIGKRSGGYDAECMDLINQLRSEVGYSVELFTDKAGLAGKSLVVVKFAIFPNEGKEFLGADIRDALRKAVADKNKEAEKP
jgi:hypothetical protein